MPELVILPPKLVAAKKKTALGRFPKFRIEIYGLRMTQAVQTPASTL